MTRWESVNSYGDEFLGGRWEGKWCTFVKFLKQIFIDADDSKFFKLLEAKELPPPFDDRKDQYFCWVSINVSSSFSARQQIPLLVSFLPQLEDCFFHQGQRRVTNWAVATSPIPLRPLYRSPPTPLPCILLNHPPTHKPTRLRAPAQALTQTSAH